MKLDPHLETRNGTFETKIRKVALQIKDVPARPGYHTKPSPASLITTPMSVSLLARG